MPVTVMPSRCAVAVDLREAAARVPWAETARRSRRVRRSPRRGLRRRCRARHPRPPAGSVARTLRSSPDSPSRTPRQGRAHESGPVSRLGPRRQWSPHPPAPSCKTGCQPPLAPDDYQRVVAADLGDVEQRERRRTVVQQRGRHVQVQPVRHDRDGIGPHDDPIGASALVTRMRDTLTPPSVGSTPSPTAATRPATPLPGT